MPETTTRLIVYACPRGPLNDQIEAYYARTLNEFGANRAHDYMPHCTLTGFFHDDLFAVPRYIAALEKAVFGEGEKRAEESAAASLRITGMPLARDWMGLTLEAEALRRRIAAFAEIAHSPTRAEALRLKDDLHLSFAYGFAPEHQAALARIAAETINPDAPVEWDLRFYERRPANQWVCHYFRSLA